MRLTTVVLQKVPICERAPTSQFWPNFLYMLWSESGGWGMWPRLTRKSQCEIFDFWFILCMCINYNYDGNLHTMHTIPITYRLYMYISNKNKVHTIPSSYPCSMTEMLSLSPADRTYGLVAVDNTGSPLPSRSKTITT